MRKIISCICIGNFSVKLVVGEFVNNTLNILSTSVVRTEGMESNKVTNSDALIACIKRAVKESSDTIGIPIKKITLGLDSVEARFTKSAAAIKINNEDGVVTGSDVTQVIQACAEGKVPEGNVLVGVIPVEFTVDGDVVLKDPKGATSQNLGLKAIIATCSKEYVSEMLNVVSLAGLKVVDVALNSVGDYYEFNNKTMDNEAGAIINIGHETSTVSIFNKGIITNTKLYGVGAKNIIKDISYIYKVNENCATALYEDLALASTNLANSKEYRIVSDINGTKLSLNQMNISEIASSRIEEILNLAKKQINILTKREISYIIVTGGLTEMKDFSLTLENSFGKNAYLGSMNIIGARDNALSSSVGLLKYFNAKFELKGKNFSIFSNEDLENMNNGGNRSNGIGESLLGKVFGYFFDS